MKKTLCLILSFILIMTITTSICFSVSAKDNFSATYDQVVLDSVVPEGYTQAGRCGEKAYWGYYEDTKTLIIAGEGAVGSVSDKEPHTFSALPFEKAVVEEGITELGDYTFAKCKSVKEVKLPDSLQKINSFTFYDCESLESFVVPKNVDFIGVYLFYNCYALEKIVVDEENTVFDSRDNCNAIVRTSNGYVMAAIRTTTLTEGIVGIAGGAYAGAPGVVEIIMPDTITELLGEPFMACNELETVVLSSSLKSIGVRLFGDCKKLKNVNIPQGVENIAPFAFMDCESLEKITIPGSVKGIYQSAFSGCKALKNLVIEEGVEVLGSFAFAHCESLVTVNLPESVKEIGPHAFVDDTSLESITINAPYCSISDYAQTIPQQAVIYGYKNSTAEAYAEKYNRTFVPSLGECEPLPPATPDQPATPDEPATPDQPSTPDQPATPDQPSKMLGDVDLDGQLSVIDATHIQRHLAKLKFLNEEQLSVADVDKDGRVSIIDATRIQRKLAKLETF